jgi:enoyl-CoA hydratase
MNAIDTGQTAGLLDACARLDTEPAIGAGVLCGAGDMFCARMDLKAFSVAGIPKGLHRLLRDGCREATRRCRRRFAARWWTGTGPTV